MAQSITDMIAAHLRAARIFRDVVVGDPDASAADLCLRGTLRTFEARMEQHVWKEALASQMGLIGLVVSATQEANVEAKTVLSDVTLTDVSTGAVLWKGDVEGRLQTREAITMTANQFLQEPALRSLLAAVDDLTAQLLATSPPLRAADAA